MVRRTKRVERGAAAVEMALVLPVLLLLIGGIVDFGRAYFTQIMLTNAAREGARAGIVQGNVVNRANAAGLTTPGWQTPTFTGDCAATPTGDIVVSTRATFSYFFLSAVPGVTSPTTLTSTARMGCP
jgi:Flp pilus assembly protein TadG